MRTRNNRKPKAEAPPKRTPPSRRSAAKATPNPPPEDDVTTSDQVEQANPSADDVEVTPETKVTRAKTRSSTRKTPVKTKTPTSAKTSSRRTRKSEVIEEPKVEESPEKDEGEDHGDEESVQKDETSENVVEESTKIAETEKEVGDHIEGESSEKEEAPETIHEEYTTEVETVIETVEVTYREEIQIVEVGDHRDGESSKKEEASEAIAEESMTKPVIDNIEVTYKEWNQFVSNVEEPPKVEEKICEAEQPMVPDIEISSEQVECSVGIEEDDPEEEDETIDLQQGEQTTVNAQTLDQSVMDAEEPLNTEENTEDKPLEREESVDHCVMNPEEPSKTNDATTENEEHLVSKDGEAISQKAESQELGIGKEELKNESDVEDVMIPEEPSKMDNDSIETEQSSDHNDMDVEAPLEMEEKTLEKEETLNRIVANSKEPSEVDEDIVEMEQHLVSNEGEAKSQKEESQELGIEKEEEVKKESDEEMKTLDDKLGIDNEPANTEEDVMDEDVNLTAKEKEPKIGDESSNKEILVESEGKDIVKDSEEGDNAEDDVKEHVDTADALAVERDELNAAAIERKLRKELEIFVGGLDRDATEEDVKKAFENVGEIVNVRLHKDSSSNKNKGYAFVKFATKELASQALLEMKNPLIRGKRCRTAPSEDNDMLFLGNICNTWTNEAVKQKLKDYGIDSVENVNVIPDVRHEGLSRGFAFLEFSCHADAMQAYKRLQKPDVIFGHTERTAKVAFAEPVREPDPEVMAQVKSVFVDGLPPQWNEEKVREKLKGCGEIVRITLARNMSTAKRRDFGFVDFTTHEDAIACIEGINSKDFGEGHSKGKVRARLSNPLPKTQVVKGGMCGGFKIGHDGGATSSSKSGRGFGVGGHEFNRPNSQRNRGFYQRGRGQTGRVGFPRERDAHMQYPPFQRREMFGRGGWRDNYGAAHDTFATGPTHLRPHPDMIRHDAASNRGYERHTPNSRLPFRPEEVYNGPVMGRQMDDPYLYDGGAHGIKRPFSMTDQEPDYMDRGRLRPRIDYSDPAVPYRAPSYRGSFGPDRNLQSHDYYGPDYHGVPRPAFNGNGRPYGGGYPPRY